MQLPLQLLHDSAGARRRQPPDRRSRGRSASGIAAQGQREIVLTGINTGDFGRTTGEPFIDLLRALDRVEGIDRYRISSIEPNLLTDEVIAFTAASKRFQSHFHIPIQSGSDRILALMRRRYNTAQFADRIAAVRRAVPDVFLGIDVIVGFPGETDEDFADTYRFLERLAPGIPARFPLLRASRHPPPPDSRTGFRRRSPNDGPPSSARCRNVCTALFTKKQVGTQARVLWESTRRNGYMYGYTGNYVKVRTPFDRALINTITPVKLTATDGEEVMDAAILSRE